MARKPIPVDSDQIAALMQGGRTAEQIVEVLSGKGQKVSRATVTRWMRDLRGKVNEARAKKTAKAVERPAADLVELDAVLDQECAPLAIVDKWIPLVERMAEAAAREGDTSAFASLTAKLVTLLEHRRKAAPPPKSDPNDNIELRKLGLVVAQRLHRLID